MSRNTSLVLAKDIHDLHPEPGMVRQVLAHNPKLMLVRHLFEENWVGVRHSHPHEQLVYVVKGRIQVQIAANAPFNVAAGESFTVDGGLDHQARALEASEVLDVFTPARDDYR